MGEHGAGKGDRYRKVNQQKWAEAWDLAFKKGKSNDKNMEKQNHLLDSDDHRAQSVRLRKSNEAKRRRWRMDPKSTPVASRGR